MDQGPKEKSSHLTLWITLCLTIPGLYLLSVPWVCIMAIDKGYFMEHMEAFETFSKGYEWLMENTPLTEPLEHYWGWCERIYGPAKFGLAGP